MLDRLEGIAARFAEIEALMADPAVAIDYTRVAELAQERSSLADIVTAYHELKSVIDQLTQAEEFIFAGDPEMKALAEEEIGPLRERREKLEADLRVMLLPKDPRDDKNVIMEIRAGAGGDEAGIFAGDLLRMYMRYAEGRGWKTDLLDVNETGVGGYKSVTFQIRGKGAFSRLKFESGVHRVQRVPATESQGRIHTSTATVAVLAEVDAVDVKIEDKDIEIDTYRSSGAGGQNVQKNETAIRIHHRPSGLIVTCQDERSKTQNLERAMSILRARLYDMEQERIRSEQEATRRSMVGSGDRSEKIRTYNYPQSRITDHRINLSIFNLAGFMNGEIDELLDEIATRDEAERLQAAGA